MREYDDEDSDDSIRLYTPVLQRVIILAAVVIAVPIVMWTITTFVRSYVARPKVPALEHVASTNTPLRVPAISAAPPNQVPPPADQLALPQLKVEATGTIDGPAPAPGFRKGSPNLASLPDVSPSPAITGRASTTGDKSTGNSAPAVLTPARLPPRPTDNAASSAPTSSDRGIAWPNPNTTNPPDFTASRLPPSAAPASAPATSTAGAEVLPPHEPLRGPVPMPRQRPGFAVAATMAANGPVPLPRARPSDAPAEAANPVTAPAYGYRPGLDDH